MTIVDTDPIPDDEIPADAVPPEEVPEPTEEPAA